MKPSSRDTLWRAAVQRHHLDLRPLNSMSHDIELYGHMHQPRVCAAAAALRLPDTGVRRKRAEATGAGACACKFVPVCWARPCFGDWLLCAASSAACEQGRPTFSVKYCLPVNLYSNTLFVDFSFIGFMLIPRSSSVKHGLRVLGSAPHYQPSVTYPESRLMCQACSCA